VGAVNRDYVIIRDEHFWEQMLHGKISYPVPHTLYSFLQCYGKLEGEMYEGKKVHHLCQVSYIAWSVDF